MKRINNLFESIISIENLKLADINARKHKHKSRGVIEHDKNKDENIIQLHDDLKNHEYKTSKYKIFKIYEPKERDIYELPYYPDRIVHHAIMNILEPIWINIFTKDTYSCIKGRGIHSAVKRLKFELKNNKEETKYCLKIDVRKFYPNINHDVLKQIIRRKIKDNELLELLDEIIDSTSGVPIGNYLSQYFANLYLAYFDHWIKEDKEIKYYYRYADDMIFLSSNKEDLHILLDEISNYLLINLKLNLKKNYQIFPVDSRSIDFLGYRFYHTHTLLRKSIKKNFIKTIIKNKKNVKKSYASYYGWTTHCNSKHLLKKINNMKKFSDLNINVVPDSFIGEKIKIEKILGSEFILLDYKIIDSKFKKDDKPKKLLTLQIEYNNENRVIFSGASILIKTAEQINKDDLPISCTIDKNYRYYVFK